MVYLLFLVAFFLCIICLCLFLVYGLMVITVEGQSMLPTLKHGDRVLFLRLSPQCWLRRGSIVLIERHKNAPSDMTVPAAKRLYVKRITAIGGDICPDTAEKVDTEIAQQSEPHQQQKRYIPNRFLFVSGDNPIVSNDSRHWGCLPLSSVRGIMLKKLVRKGKSLLNPSPISATMPTDHYLEVGTQAPMFFAYSTEGIYVTLHDYACQRLLLIFLSDNPLTRALVPSWLIAASHLEAKSVTTIFVCNEAEKHARIFAQRYDFTRPVLVAPKTHHPFFRDYGISLSRPAYYLIDCQGKVCASGFASNQLASTVERLLLSDNKDPISPTGIVDVSF